MQDFVYNQTSYPQLAQLDAIPASSCKDSNAIVSHLVCTVRHHAHAYNRLTWHLLGHKCPADWLDTPYNWGNL